MRLRRRIRWRQRTAAISEDTSQLCGCSPRIFRGSTGIRSMEGSPLTNTRRIYDRNNHTLLRRMRLRGDSLRIHSRTGFYASLSLSRLPAIQRRSVFVFHPLKMVEQRIGKRMWAYNPWLQQKEHPVKTGRFRRMPQIEIRNRFLATLDHVSPMPCASMATGRSSLGDPGSSQLSL